MEELASRRNRGTSKAAACSDAQDCAVLKPRLACLVTTLDRKRTKPMQRLGFTLTLVRAHNSKSFEFHSLCCLRPSFLRIFFSSQTIPEIPLESSELAEHIDAGCWNELCRALLNIYKCPDSQIMSLSL